MGLLLQSERKQHVQADLEFLGIHRFDAERESPGAAERLASEVNNLTWSRRTGGLSTFYVDVGPFRITLPFDEVSPDHLDRRCNHCRRTHTQAHGVDGLSELRDPECLLVLGASFVAAILAPITDETIEVAQLRPADDDVCYAVADCLIQ